jgi:hypothetical protein
MHLTSPRPANFRQALTDGAEAAHAYVSTHLFMNK